MGCLIMDAIKQQDPVILFKTESNKHLYFYAYQPSARLYGYVRFNKSLIIEAKYNDITTIPLETIECVEGVSMQKVVSGFQIDGIHYLPDEYKKVLDNLTIGYDENGNPLCSSIDNFNEWTRIVNTKLELTENIETYKEIYFIVSPMPTDGYCITPLYHESLNKLDLYKFDRLAYALDCCKEQASKYNYSYVTDNCKDYEWTYSVNGLTYLKINNIYSGDESMVYSEYIGNIIEIDILKKAIADKISLIFRKANMKFETLNNILTVNDLYRNASDALQSLLKVDTKISTRSEYNNTITYIKEMITKLEKVG